MFEAHVTPVHFFESTFAKFNMCHVCAESYGARCEGMYQHWELGQMWEAFICVLLLQMICPIRFLSSNFGSGV